MESIVQRLKYYLEFKGVKVSTAEKVIGLSNGSLSKPFNNNTTIKTDNLETFLITYNDINSEWLLTGEGEMLKSGSKKEAEEEKNKGPDHRYVELLQKNNQYLEQIVALKDEVSLLKEKISILKKRDIPVHTSQMVAESPQKLEKRTKETAD